MEAQISEPIASDSRPARRAATLVNQERNFGIDELFFSTTDSKGNILTGNDVFVRVSGYELSELVGKPHNIIRHPDMPRCVFKLLWSHVQSGKSIAAYVKNLAKDGRFYWVVAAICPVKGGYLSVRIKPSTTLHPLVAGIYAELLGIEQDLLKRKQSLNQAMAASTDRLLGMLADKGFSDYDDFMRVMLAEELKSRDSVLASRETPAKDFTKQAAAPAAPSLQQILDVCCQAGDWLRGVFASMGDLRVLNEQLERKSSFVCELAQSTRLHSLNALIEASKLQDFGAAVGVVAEKMASTSDGMIGIIGEMNRHIERIFPIAGSVMFDLSASKLKIEMAGFFTAELLSAKGSRASIEQEDTADRLPIDRQIVNNLDMLFNESFVSDVCKVLGSAKELRGGLGSLEKNISDLRDLVRTLEFIHISGRVEAARSEKFSAFGVIFGQVLTQVTDAKAELDDFLNVLSSIRSNLEAVLSSERGLRPVITRGREGLAELERECSQ